VSALNEFVYCPRRYYYQRYYDEIGEPYELVEDAQDEAAGWLHEHPTVCLRVFGTTHPSVLTDHEVTACSSATDPDR